jgi:hypothetical protein
MNTTQNDPNPNPSLPNDPETGEMEDPKFVVPNFGNATPLFLTDELGKIKNRLKALKKYEGLYTAALLAKLPKVHSEDVAPFGEFSWPEAKFKVIVEPYGSMVLDQERVKGEMGLEWWADHLKATEGKGFKVSVKANK